MFFFVFFSCLQDIFVKVLDPSNELRAREWDAFVKKPPPVCVCVLSLCVPVCACVCACVCTYVLMCSGCVGSGRGQRGVVNESRRRFLESLRQYLSHGRKMEHKGLVFCAVVVFVFVLCVVCLCCLLCLVFVVCLSDVFV